MFRHQINKTVITDDGYALDQRRISQAPGSDVGAKHIKRKIFHPAGNFCAVGGVFQRRVDTVLYQQDRTPGFRQAKTAIQSRSLGR